MMTGSNPFNGSTSGRHPSLLQQQGCRHDLGDQLRRRAIQNSYDCRSLCGTASTQANYCMATEVPVESRENRKLLPPLSHKKEPLSKQSIQYRSSKFGDVHVVLNRPKSSSRVHAHGRKRSIKRSSSYSSVAVTHTGPTLRNNSSSYVCHPTSAVRVPARGASYSHATLPSKKAAQHKINDDSTSALKRSSSYSEIQPDPSPPCTTTTLDSNSSMQYARATGNRTSSARSNNPHPVGLVFKNPYNSHSTSKPFEIWTPNVGHHTMSPNDSRHPHGFKHIGHANVTGDHMKPYNLMVSGRREPPDVKYSMSSIYRNNYRSPQMHTRTEYDSHMPITRFGSSPAYFPAKGIVPTSMSPRIPKQASSPRKVDKRITLHPPRGKKVASLI